VVNHDDEHAVPRASGEAATRTAASRSLAVPTDVGPCAWRQPDDRFVRQQHQVEQYAVSSIGPVRNHEAVDVGPFELVAARRASRYI
jgi:hypothetical protein